MIVGGADNGNDPFSGLGISTSANREEDQNEARDELGQEDFLELMIAQFQNQDPFDPMENGEFLGQLAQFGTVNGINEMSESFEDFSGAMKSSQALQASGLVGRSVLAEEGDGVLDPEVGLNGAVELDQGAEDVVVTIRNDSGERMNRMSLGTQSEGRAKFHWDGVNEDGEQMEPGTYSIEAEVVRGNESESGQVLTHQNVESVTLDQGGKGVTLNTPTGELGINDVREFL